MRLVNSTRSATDADWIRSIRLNSVTSDWSADIRVAHFDSHSPFASNSVNRRWCFRLHRMIFLLFWFTLLVTVHLIFRKSYDSNGDRIKQLVLCWREIGSTFCLLCVARLLHLVGEIGFMKVFILLFRKFIVQLNKVADHAIFRRLGFRNP